MKKTLITLANLLIITLVTAQAPNQFKYQAVLRNADGTIMAEESVAVYISILQGSISGTSVFNETHNTATTSLGLINLNIGSVNDMSLIDWSADTYFIEIIINGTTMGTSQLLSVPYALHAGTAESITGTINETDPVFGAHAANEITSTNITNWTTAFDWGDHSLQGYLTNYTETDPIFGAHAASGITSTNITNWTTAFDWGDHSTVGYLTKYEEKDPVFSNLFNITNPSHGQLLKYNGLTNKWKNFTPNYLSSEVDGSITNEIQYLILTDNILSLTTELSGREIDLSRYLDDQTVAFTNGTGISVTGTYPSFTIAQTAKYQIGDFAQGGIVFWLDETGEHGLVCAKEDQSSGIRWYAGTYGNTQAKGDGPYSGEANTAVIIAAQVAIGDDNSTYAARICNELQITENGKIYGDWYLPAKYELNLMYQNRAIINSTATANGGVAFATIYWSSTEYNSNNAWIQVFSNGNQLSCGKYGTNRVRAVRAF